MNPTTLLPLLALFLMVSMSATRSRGEEAGETPLVNGLRWSVAVEPQVSDREEVLVHVRLLAPASPEEANWTFVREGGADPYLELRDAGGNVRRHDFDVIPAKDSQDRTVNRYSAAVEASVKLVETFGALSPGTYTLRAILPSEAYALTKAPAYAPAAVASAGAKFAVQRVTVEDALAANKQTKDVVLQIAPTLAGGGGLLATITNTTPSPIHITAYVEGRNPATLGNVPLSVPVMPEIFRGSSGWSAPPAGWCGTGLGGVTIAPGGSQRLQLHVQTAGVIRFCVPYRFTKAPANAQARTAVSNVVDLFPKSAAPTTAPAAK